MGIANELIERGWIQGTERNEEGVCLGQAAIDCNGSLAMRAVAEVLARYGVSVVAFNDTPGRTFDEVLRVAKEADEILDAS